MTESKLIAKDREVVVPGEVLAEGMDFLPSFGTYRLESTIRAGMMGLVKIDGKVLKLIPLSGRYIPKRDDMVICRVIDVLMSGWRFETNTAYSAMLPLKDASSRFIEKGADLTKFYDLDDYVVAKITNVTSQKLIDLSMKGPGLRKLTGGRIIDVNPYKVPRIIGKQGSMVSIIKDATGCKIVVGQNGRVWIEGEPEKEVLAVRAIQKIEQEAHISGLTDTIKKFLEGQVSK